MTDKNTLKLSELIKREATEEQYKHYGKTVASWVKEAYDNFAFTLYRPDARLSTDEDKYLYSMEVTLLRNGREEDWDALEKEFILNNFDTEIASEWISKELRNVFDDEGIAVVSHSITGGRQTSLSGTGPQPIVGKQPVDARIYFSKVEDKDKVIEAGKENNTEVVFVEE